MAKASTSKRDQQLILGATVVVAGVVLWIYYGYLFQPLLRKVSALSQEAKAAKATLQHLEQLVMQEPRLRQQEGQLREEVLSLRTVLPSEDFLPTVIERLSDMATQSGLKIQTIFPQRALETVGASTASKSPASATSPLPKLYEEIPIRIDALSGFHQLGAFLSRVEASAQPMEVQTLRVRSDPKEMRRHLVQLTITVYFSAADRPRT